METLLKKEANIYWNEDCQQGVDVLNQKLVIVSILVLSYWQKVFHVHLDASSISLGAV
jgi:hypothetical protein